MVVNEQAVYWQPPVPVNAGPEMEALAAFHFDCSWTGTVAAGGMGPGSPEMDAIGEAVYRPIMDGAWLVGDFAQEQFIRGERVINWRAHVVIGWDPRAGEYRATYVDNNGSSALLHGWIEDDRFIMETLGETEDRNRLVWTRIDSRTVAWRNDYALGSGPWTLVEEYVCARKEM